MERTNGFSLASENNREGIVWIAYMHFISGSMESRRNWKKVFFVSSRIGFVIRWFLSWRTSAFLRNLFYRNNGFDESEIGEESKNFVILFLVNRDTRIRSNFRLVVQFIIFLETSTLFSHQSLCLSRVRRGASDKEKSILNHCIRNYNVVQISN